MEQVKALNALESFLALSKSATSPRAAADLVERATSAANTFVFTELLETPQVQNLASSPDYAPHLQLLNIFSYGTYSTYLETPGLPVLNDAQKLKLRQLSLLTLARASSDNSPASASATANGDDKNHGGGLAYASLLAPLGLSTARELEDLVISAVYAGLVRAQLDAKRARVVVNNVAALRDVAPGAVPGLLTSLRAWAARCDDALATLDRQVAEVRARADQRAAEAAASKERMDEMMHPEKHTSGLDELAAAAAAAGGPVGGGRFANFSSVFGGGHMPGRGGSARSTQNSRFGKRGSGQMDASSAEGVDDDDAMVLDEEEEESGDAKKRNSRRKL